MMLAACQTNQTPISVSEKQVEELTKSCRIIICQGFTPIYYAANDTVETRRQVVAHNAVWDKQCKVPNFQR